MTIHEAFAHPFTIGAMVGLGVGMIFFLFALVLRWNKSSEFKRFRQMVNDRMKFDTEFQELASAERIRLQEENKNLKAKVTQQESTPTGKLAKNMEIMARAERQLLRSAPTFMAAWEDAKTSAQSELEAEALGKAKPRSAISRLFGSSNGSAATQVNGSS
jgi:hypothetical protein